MTEAQVNQSCKKWIEQQGFKYKGILNKGQVPVPDGIGSVWIDHQGCKDNPPDILWVEAKGSVEFSQLLQGFIRVAYAVWWGGGRGLIAAPRKEANLLRDQSKFLSIVGKAIAGEGSLGVFNAEDFVVKYL